MAERPANRAAIKWLAIALALLAAAWLGFFITMEYRTYLEDRFGPRPDVYDSLVCAAYVGRRTWPWLSVVLLLDALAFLSLAVTSLRGIPMAVQMGILLLLIASGSFSLVGVSCYGVLHGVTWHG